MNRWLARIVLTTAGIIWGFGFLINDTILANGWTEAELLFVRFFTATLAIFIIYWKRIIKTDKNTIKWGLFLGIFLYLGFYFQTWGLVHTTPSNNALVTSAYIFMMPFIIYIFERKHIYAKTLVAGIITMIGIGFATVNVNEVANVNIGDILTFVGAIFYAVHIYLLGKKAKEVDLFVLMAFQLLMFTIIALPVMLIKDGLPPVEFGNPDSMKYFLYAVFIGFFASFVAFLFQSIGQKNTNEAEAAILISTESLFGPMFALMFGFEDPSRTLPVIIATILVFTGIILSEVDLDYMKKKKATN